jgi:hypothetical protein
MFVVHFVTRVNQVTYLPVGRLIIGHSRRSGRDEARGMGPTDTKLNILG